MKVSNVFQSKSAFKILQTTERSQSAVMALQAGDSSSDELNAHPKSDQILIVLEGTLSAEIAAANAVLRKGDSVIVPAGTLHKFTNSGDERVVTFSVYSPPAYPPGAAE